MTGLRSGLLGLKAQLCRDCIICVGVGGLNKHNKWENKKGGNYAKTFKTLVNWNFTHCVCVCVFSEYEKGKEGACVCAAVYVCLHTSGVLMLFFWRCPPCSMSGLWPLDMSGYQDLQTSRLTGHQRGGGRVEGVWVGGRRNREGNWEEIKRKLGWTQSRKDKGRRAVGNVCVCVVACVCVRERISLTFPHNVAIKEMKSSIKGGRRRCV